MKTVKEKSKEYYKVIKVRDEHSRIVDTSSGEYFEQGAYWAIDEILRYISELPCKSQGEHYNQRMLVHRINQLKGE